MMPDTQVSVSDTLMDLVVTQLSDKLILTEWPTEQLKTQASAGVVRGGKLQDDPTIGEINILVHSANADWPNVLYEQSIAGGFNVDHTYEFGSSVPSQFWLLRFFVEFRMFFENEPNRDNAFRKSQLVLFRTMHAISMLNNGNFRATPRDSFGFKPHQVQIRESFVREGGGPGTFIWRGELKIEFLSSFEPNVNN
jgi:hypothetical protein